MKIMRKKEKVDNVLKLFRELRNNNNKPWVRKIKKCSQFKWTKNF